MEKKIYRAYLKLLNYENCPNFLQKCLNVPSLTRLKSIGYFCGMDFASKDIYNFQEYITRFDHSLTVALLTWHYTKDKVQTLAGLFHDVGTPVFSHVIDYMNKDYINQESTEEFTEEIIKKDKTLLKYLTEDDIDVESIINFKNYSVVDNKRPKLCADRLDGIFLTSLYWTKTLNISEIEEILKDSFITTNEEGMEEIAFANIDIAKKVLENNIKMDEYCHSKEDNYMMELLAKITSYLITNNHITYKELFIKTEDEMFKIIESIDDDLLQEDYKKFKYIKKNEIDTSYNLDIKIRDLNPLVKTKRLKNIIE